MQLHKPPADSLADAWSTAAHPTQVLFMIDTEAADWAVATVAEKI
ncbi:hypothetical protein AB0E04_40970 [Streptomyces sp. NPDC048251]